MWKIGASSAGQAVIDNALFEEFARVGFKQMEISPLYAGLSTEKTREFFKKVIKPSEIIKMAQDNGVGIWSYHLPFGNLEVNPASFDKKVRDDLIVLDNEMIETAAELGAKVVVVHASGEPIAESDRRQSIEYAKEVIAAINETAKKNGLLLAVENLPRTCLGKNSAEMKEFLAIDDNVRVCFDVNHLLEETHKDFVAAVGDKIVTLHLSDYDFVDEKHMVPGRGKIDWKELVQLLKGINYNGPFMNEMRAVRECDKVEGRATYSELFEASDRLLKLYY